MEIAHSGIPWDYDELSEIALIHVLTIEINEARLTENN
jgi:hypothetical protein